MSTLGEVAQACNLTPRRVAQLAQEGVLPRVGRGAYDLRTCLEAYIRYLQTALSGKGTMDETGGVSSLKAERQRLVKSQADREELELAKARGELMAVGDHKAILSDMVLETKARIMAVGPRVSARLVAQDSRAVVQTILNEAHKEALMDLSKLVPRMPAHLAQGAKPMSQARGRKG